MFPPKSRKFALTLVCYVALALVLTDVAQSKGYAHVPARRDHIDLDRMIRKRGPTARDLGGLLGGGAAGAGNDPPPVGQTATSSDNTRTPQSSQSTVSSSSPLSSPSDPLNLSGILGSLTSSSSSLTSSSSSTSLSSSSSSSSSSLPATTSSTSPPPSPSSTPPPSTSTKVLSIDYETVTNTSVPVATDSVQATSGASTTKRTTLTVVIVIASCVAGIAIIWTLIRKWKFRPSAQFEDRMQPIDWQPAGPDDGPSLHRTASNASHSSFHSGSAHGDGVGSNLDHDFTAGPAHLAPVGGYADLARGPSPQPYRGPSPGPQMQEALVRGPSLTRPTYDQYGVPLHHQGAYANDAYRGMTGTRY